MGDVELSLPEVLRAGKGGQLLVRWSRLWEMGPEDQIGRVLTGASGCSRVSGAGAPTWEESQFF